MYCMYVLYIVCFLHHHGRFTVKIRIPRGINLVHHQDLIPLFIPQCPFTLSLLLFSTPSLTLTLVIGGEEREMEKMGGKKNRKSKERKKKKG